MSKDRIIKAKTHAEKRFLERIGGNPSVLKKIQAHMKGAPIPAGTHHVALDHKGYVVLKDVGRKRKQHVVATVLSREMIPPGMDVTQYLKKAAEARQMLLFLEKKASGVELEAPLATQLKLDDPVALWRGVMNLRRPPKAPGDPGQPQDPEYYQKLLAGKRPTTPFKDLIMGRRLPARGTTLKLEA